MDRLQGRAREVKRRSRRVMDGIRKQLHAARGKIVGPTKSPESLIVIQMSLLSLFRALTTFNAFLLAAAIFFTTYEHSKSFLASPSSPLASLNAPPAVGHMLSSGLAEAAACLILTPAEVIKQRAQVANRTRAASSNTSKPSSSSNASFSASASASASKSATASAAAQAAETVRQVADRATAGSAPGSTGASVRGLAQDASNTAATSSSHTHAHSSSSAMGRTLFRGYLALLGRNLPFTAIQFPLYEHLRGILSRAVGLKAGTRASDGGVEDVHADDAQSSSSNENATSAPQSEFVKAGLVSGASAAIAGSIAAAVTTPVDVAKTRIMLGSDGASSSSSSSSASTRGVLSTMRNIAQKEGALALMRGGALRSAWTALGAGVYLGSYEAGRLWWRERQLAKGVAVE